MGRCRCAPPAVILKTAGNCDARTGLHDGTLHKAATSVEVLGFAMAAVTDVSADVFPATVCERAPLFTG